MTAFIRNDGLIDIIHEYNNININLNNINTLYYYDLSGTYINNDTDVNTSIPSIPLLQKRVADIMIAHAIQSKEACPITMEPIDSASICVSPCYHCFQAEAIRTWLSTESTCPVCREKCTDKAK
jgi:SUMO ligase MMS21 Smc5/6 complex component